ncbi:hypothetical protein [Sellimonas catena]|uniref:Uncharacterized protein n=1 Tax=Sellimonas catena TaxID=2994035 RepID=A0A9W6FHL4_9FIRM|nr:hypothetical protein [Sellimonas catena]GLG92090.1 hypothetical protein Selli2_35170 [Sellimonas catena]
MYLEGSEFVTYTPVEAYGVSTYADGVVSGGNSGDNFISGGMRFLWVYDPSNPSKSGFTGCGKWFCNVPNTPLEGITSDEILAQEFESGRQNLNREFEKWQQKVASDKENSYVFNFSGMIYAAGGTGCAVTVNA